MPLAQARRLSVLGPVVLTLSLLHCGPAKAPREQARAVVLTIADGVRQADLACAAIAKAQADLSLAHVCAALVAEARQELITAEDGVNAWDAAATNHLPCAARSAASMLARLVAAVNRAGGNTPPAVDDALRFAPVLTESCRG